MRNKRGLLLCVVFAVGLGVLLLNSAGWGSKQASESQKESPKSQAKYVGVNACRSCHSKPRLGKQFQTWASSGHARAYIVLDTGDPERVPPEARGLVKVGYGKAIREEAQRLKEDMDCLKCHATASDVAPDQREPTWHVEDGVQCEACHGPGSRHVTWYKQRKRKELQGPPPEARLKRPKLKEVCLTCHKEKPSHAMLKRKPFDPEKAWKRIAHSIPKKRKEGI